MTKARLIKASGDYARGLMTESGVNYRKEVQDIAPAIQRVKEFRDIQDRATKLSNPNEWRHKASIPMTVLVDWLNKNKFTIDQWARNDGGITGKTYPNSRSGVKDKFLSYFLSRDFSKLHNEHVTTKRESSQIVVPNFIGSSKREDLRGTEDSGSKLA